MAGRGKSATLPSWMTGSTSVDTPSDQTTQPIQSQLQSPTYPPMSTNAPTATNPYGFSAPQMMNPQMFPQGQQPFSGSMPQFGFPTGSMPGWPPQQQQMHTMNPMQMPSPFTHPSQLGMPTTAMSFPPTATTIPTTATGIKGIPPRVPISTTASSSTSSSSTKAIDPMNDITAWSEHETSDKRKYWYNRITGTSTYEKPFCLKTPEERSIPPCAWKEYSTGSEGKKYYSNGTESVWVMPEEYRIWKEKMDALSAKKTAATAAITSATTTAATTSSSNNSLSSTTVSNGTITTTSTVNKVDQDEREDTIKRSSIRSIGESSNEGEPLYSEQPPSITKPSTYTTNSTTNGTNGSNTNVSASASSTAVRGIPAVYNNKEDAKAAFIDLLNEKNISSSMKQKEIQDICQGDSRWEAVKGGERKQEIAEYQTKKLKIEKEQAKIKAKKHRDAFLLLLAETMEIDSRTRWKDAIPYLSSDNRYKAIERDYDKEELFYEFVLELEKKEREERLQKRDNAMKWLQGKLHKLYHDNKIHYKMIWSDCKSMLIELVHKEIHMKGVLEDSDVRRGFHDFIEKKEMEIRDNIKQKRMELQKCLDIQLNIFQTFLESCARKGVITHTMKWKEFQTLEIVQKEVSYQEAMKCLKQAESKEYSEDSSHTTSSSTTSEYSKKNSSNDFFRLSGDPRDVYYNFQKILYDYYKADYRLIYDTVIEYKIPLNATMEYSEFKGYILKIVGMKDISNTGEPAIFLTEDGEELDEFETLMNYNPMNIITTYSLKAIPMHLRTMLICRPLALEQVFQELHADCLQQQIEIEKKQKKRESRFMDLLSDHFYRSDHVGTVWEVAKSILEQYKEYHDISRDDRKRLYYIHMEALSQKLESKTKAMKQYEVDSSATTTTNSKEYNNSSNSNITPRESSTRSTAASAMSMNNVNPHYTTTTTTKSNSSNNKNSHVSQSIVEKSLTTNPLDIHLDTTEPYPSDKDREKHAHAHAGEEEEKEKEEKDDEIHSISSNSSSNSNTASDTEDIIHSHHHHKEKKMKKEKKSKKNKKHKKDKKDSAAEVTEDSTKSKKQKTV